MRLESWMALNRGLGSGVVGYGDATALAWRGPSNPFLPSRPFDPTRPLGSPPEPSRPAFPPDPPWPPSASTKSLALLQRTYVLPHVLMMSFPRATDAYSRCRVSQQRRMQVAKGEQSKNRREPQRARG